MKERKKKAYEKECDKEVQVEVINREREGYIYIRKCDKKERKKEKVKRLW